MIQFFFFIVIMFWPLFLIWWVISPRHFPFFAKRTQGRLKIIAINILSFFILIFLFGLLPITDESLSLIDAIGMLLGLFAVGFLFFYSIKAGRRVAFEQPPIIVPPKLKPKKSEALIRAKSTIVSTKPKKRDSSYERKEKIKPEPPVKPNLKEDFELGDDDFCDMKYQNAEGVISTRKILIRKLKASNNGDWLVSAVDLDAKRLKSFRVDRIVSLSHNNQTWTKYEDILGVVRTFETII